MSVCIGMEIQVQLYRHGHRGITGVFLGGFKGIIHLGHHTLLLLCHRSDHVIDVCHPRPKGCAQALGRAGEDGILGQLLDQIAVRVVLLHHHQLNLGILRADIQDHLGQVGMKVGQRLGGPLRIGKPRSYFQGKGENAHISPHDSILHVLLGGGSLGIPLVICIGQVSIQGVHQIIAAHRYGDDIRLGNRCRNLVCL